MHSRILQILVQSGTQEADTADREVSVVLRENSQLRNAKAFGSDTVVLYVL